LVTGIIGGIFSAYQLGEMFGELNWHTGQAEINVGIFLIVFLVTSVGTLLITAIIMTYLDLCSNVEKTTKDTAEIKEILKNK